MKFTLPASLLAGTIALAASTLPAFARPLATDTSVQERSVQNPPHFVIYSDKWVAGGAPPNASAIAGWNVFALSFYLDYGPTDMAQGWQELTADQRTAIKSEYAAAGIKLIVAAFGSSATPTSSGIDAKTIADQIAAWVKQYDLDGVDVDYEDFNAFNGGTAEQWLIDFTTELRAQLPDNQYIITHAPVAPWFRNDGYYSAGGYLKIDSAVGSSIDWYNVQFYNQGTTGYTTCGDLVTKSTTASGTSIMEIGAAVGLDKVVLGKPADASDATNGYVDETTLATCVSQAKSDGWNAGLMLWQYPDEPADFITTVWG